MSFLSLQDVHGDLFALISDADARYQAKGGSAVSWQGWHRRLLSIAPSNARKRRTRVASVMSFQRAAHPSLSAVVVGQGASSMTPVVENRNKRHAKAEGNIQTAYDGKKPSS
jgi:hypothetical protein